jgi:diadenosine tetraphosphate (Ap4A) HIT family hydrolase
MAPCVFCDVTRYRPTLLAETSDFYALPTLGQISDGGHVLLITKPHEIALGALDATRMASFMTFRERVHRAVSERYGPTISFEHGIAGQSVPHAHMQLLPSSIDLLRPLQFQYPRFTRLSSLADLSDLFAEHRLYLLYGDHDANYHAFFIDLIPQYLRLFAAEQMNRRERGDWKAWRAVPAQATLDNSLVAETVASLRPALAS